MTRKYNQLNARTVKTFGEGFHADGQGLYLRVESSGARRWVFVFFQHGRRREMGLGSLADLPLAEARQAVQDARKLVAKGICPIDARRAERAAVKAVPFGDLARQVVADLSPQWKNPKVAQQWLTTLTVDAAPLGSRLVSAIGTDDVLAVLKPIWLAKPETAARLRGRIERVLDAAKAKGMREGENPARWKGHLSILLPRRARSSRRHHPSLHYDKMRAFMSVLRKSESISASALDFTVLTIARTSESLFARGGEFDLNRGIWTVPPERMKSGREHRVPLSPPALAIARTRIDLCGDGYLFPGLRQGRPLSNMAMLKMLDLLGYGDFTVHGFRATFKSWATDRTAFPREIIEASLAHLVGDEAEQAYLRTDALERRRGLMAAWADYCEPGNRVVQLIA
jgi:integrase